MTRPATNFKIVEATIDDIHSAYKSGDLTCRQLIQMYLDRIEAFDKKGPAINAIITINSKALDEADRLDAAYKSSGPCRYASWYSCSPKRSGRCQRHADNFRFGIVQGLLSR